MIVRGMENKDSFLPIPPDTHSFATFFCPTHLSAFLKGRVKGPEQNFGFIFFAGSATVLSRRLVRCSRCGEGGSFAEADSVAVRGVSRRTSGQRCVRRDAKHRARDARAPHSKASQGQ